MTQEEDGQFARVMPPHLAPGVPLRASRFSSAHMLRQAAAQPAVQSRCGIYFLCRKRFFIASCCAAET